MLIVISPIRLHRRILCLKVNYCVLLELHLKLQDQINRCDSLCPILRVTESHPDCPARSSCRAGTRHCLTAHGPHKGLRRRLDQLCLRLVRVGRFSDIMPELQRITGILIHPLCQNTILSGGSLQRELHRHILPGPLSGIIPQNAPEGAILHFHYDSIVIFENTFSLTTL